MRPLSFLGYMHRKPHPLGCGGRHLFLGGPAPYPNEGVDPTQDGLGCEA